MHHKCPYCGASLHEEASFCPYCAKGVNKRILAKPPGRLWRNVARKALVAVILAGIVAGIWQWSRPKVCHGNGEILYTDRDGTYQLLLGATTDRFQPVYEYTVDFEVDQDGRMPSRLYINHVVTGANAKEVFLQKVIRVTAELIQPEGKESPWHCTEPSQQDFAPEAALVSF